MLNLYLVIKLYFSYQIELLSRLSIIEWLLVVNLADMCMFFIQNLKNKVKTVRAQTFVPIFF